MEPVLPAGLVLALHAITTVAVAVFGGGAASSLLCLRGVAAPGRHRILLTLVRLPQHWSDPAAAWPADPRPGPAWLTWTCVVVVAIVWVSLLGIAGAELDVRWRHRATRVGLGTRHDLRRIGLDAKSAARKSAQEFPELAERSSRSHRRWWRR